MSKEKLKVIISGGGTGGHIYPAIAVAQTLQKELNGNVEFLFVGASDRMEMEKVPKAGYAIEGLWISGLQRSLSAKNLLFPVKVVSSVLKSLGIINRFKPDLAIGFGGYASGAMMYAATLKGIPSMIHEQNSYAGITNKILKNRVKKIAVAYDNMERFFPANKIVKTGNPVRSDICEAGNKRAEGIAFFGLNPTRKTVLIIGGSLGARTINQSIEKDLELLKDANVNVIWQTGKLFQSEKASQMPVDFCLKVSPFIYEMNLAYAAADIVISRAGALSIAELAIVGKPTILVPSPNVSEDHQTKNAMALVDKNAAILVKDSESKTILVPSVIALLNDTQKQENLAVQIKSMAIEDAAQRIVQELLALRK
ncbi:MAG: undecaprenyldiphospho-muramoylpentapeptide beta-N-acetylglucosaminyltransferase [Bacteroidia bacterium]|nr:undecaprenyldiphospho-muramoylpentapeptide beta-N-acetylglucosaminyltransferase [Bacteroidia bacterium]MCF8426913.1 undecaprenyldiphospho-muramoylpentapeptide beta-N-acetylglucosaminyltransferase [Bacteroidia bacterium]MCF8448080.1 undecaprenyldiphospho-muramoylpentapeptide beta-N-acetylglucosaminyltransferase [Bacteroidia bacterium]